MISPTPHPTVCSIIDIRWHDQYVMGHIEGSINIPSDEILSHLDMLRSMRQPILLCCQSGYRSRLAQRQLQHNGITAIDGGDYRVLSRDYGLPIESV